MDGWIAHVLQIIINELIFWGDKREHSYMGVTSRACFGWGEAMENDWHVFDCTGDDFFPLVFLFVVTLNSTLFFKLI